MKKILLSCVCLMLTICGYAEKINVDGICYNISSSNKNASVEQKKYPDRYAGDIVIPATFIYNGQEYTVTSVGYSAFNYCPQLTSIVLPNTITEIKNGAFSYCEELTSFELPNSVSKIGTGVFSACKSLDKIIVSPDNNYFKYENQMLLSKDGTELIQVLYKKEGVLSIPNTVKTIYANALNWCKKITAIEIPASVETIQPGAFSQTFGVSTVVVDKGNKNYKVENDNLLTYDGETLMYVPYSISTLTIPNSVKKIESYAVYNITRIVNEVIIPDNVVEIGDYAFEACINIPSVTLGKGLKKIYRGAFRDLSRCKTVNVKAEEPPVVEDDNFEEILETAQLNVPEGSFSAYKNSKYVWSRFSNFKAQGGVAEDLTGVVYNGLAYKTFAADKTAQVINNQYHDDEGYYVNYCPEYSGDIVVPSTIEVNGVEYTVTTIAPYAFSVFYGSQPPITSITLPNTIVEIGDFAFRYNYDMTYINLPSSVIKMGTNPFAYCTSLETIDMNNQNFVLENNKLMTADRKKLIFVVVGLSDENIETEVVIPEGIETIDDYAMTHAYGVVSVTLPESLQSIGSLAFNACTGLKSIIIPKNVKTISENPFLWCQNLGEIYVDENNMYYKSEDNMLLSKDGSSLIASALTKTSIEIPKSVSRIETLACYAIKGLTSIVIPDNVEFLDDRAFGYCENLQTICLGNNNNGLIKSSFYGCFGIKTINCSSSTPWTIDNIYDSWTFFGWNGDGYSDELYETIEVNVPLGSLDAYKSDAEWSKFNNIKEKTSTGIENLNMKENDIQERFDLRGISQRNPTRGLNIVRLKNGTTKKYILK